MTEYMIYDGQETQAVILPEKGATVISLKRGATEFLYCDRENLESPERPRCGIPFLFPIFGRLADGQYAMDGRTYAMEIHGFGHTSPWQVVEHSGDSLTLRLDADERTLAMYPFRFRTELRFVVKGGTLTIGQRFENLDDKAMPYNFGFHPYFRLEELPHARIEANAGLHFDFTVGKPVPFGHGSVGVSIPDGVPESGSAFMEVTGPTILHIPEEGRRITMDNDGNFPQLVLWTLAGKPFLCAEPINGTANGLNTRVYRTLQPGEVKEAVLNIHVDNI